MEEELTTLFDQIRRTLMSAGYDVNTADPGKPGLYIAKTGGNVTLTWSPTPELVTPSIVHAERDTAQLPGMRDVVHKALVSVLVSAGFALTETEAPNTLRITGTHADRARG